MTKDNRKKVLLIGLAGYNLGDEAIAVSAANSLRTKYEVVITTVKAGVIAKYQIPEVLVDRKSLRSWISLINAIRRSDVVIFGGGSLVQDKLGLSLFSGVLNFLLQYVILAKILGKHTRTLPIGVDRLQTRLGRMIGSLALNLLDEINVRDNTSKELVNFYSGRTDARIYADPAFLLSPPQSELATLAKDTAGYMVISLVLENIDANTLRLIYNVIERTDSLKSYRKIYIAMDTRESDELHLYREILCIHPEQIVIPKDAFEAQKIISGGTLLIAMRLHALILGLGRTPSFCISRTTKTEAFCTTALVPFQDLNSLDFTAEAFENWMNEIKNQKNLALKNQRAASLKLVEKARAFFHE